MEPSSFQQILAINFQGTDSLEEVVSTEGKDSWSVTFKSFEEAIKHLEENDYEGILLTGEHITLPEMVAKLRMEDGKTPIVVLSSEDSKIFEEGADDILPIAASFKEIQSALFKARYRRNFVEKRKQKKENPEVHRSIIFESRAMRGVLEVVHRLGPFSPSVIITGESGTGKELIAREIHNLSSRNYGPFVPVNCGAIPEGLIESELFGHKRGAFTDAVRDKIGLFEIADGGTLFLDEIGDLPLHLQVKLLRTLQEQEIRRVGDEQSIKINVRVIAATLRNLEEEVEKGRFRDDLFYRLNVVSIVIPPLRERKEDIPILIRHFIKKFNVRLGLKVKGIEDRALQKILEYSWKGNVRELENCIERAMVMSSGPYLEFQSLPQRIQNITEVDEPTPFANDEILSIKQKSKELEIALIKRALKATKGNRTHAAKVLEISHRALLYKLKEYELE